VAPFAPATTATVIFFIPAFISAAVILFHIILSGGEVETGCWALFLAPGTGRSTSWSGGLRTSFASTRRSLNGLIVVVIDVIALFKVVELVVKSRALAAPATSWAASSLHGISLSQVTASPASHVPASFSREQ